MDFYKKNGAGRPTIEEQALIDGIKRVVAEKGINPDAIPPCSTIDDLIYAKQFVDELDNHPDRVQFEEDFEEDEQPFEETDLAEEPEPLLEDEPTSEIEPDSGSSAERFEQNPDEFVADNYNPFADPIIERSYNQANGGSVAPVMDDDDGLELEESKGNPLSDLPPHTKRRAAEQTADTLLKGYAQLAPIPFKWLSKFPESKIEKMAFNGEIDLSIEVSDGVTFDEYIKQTNEQLDEIFEVDSDTLSDIREPLIEVLLEQNMELTPTQRLIAAVLSHLAQMLSVALKLRTDHNRILAYQKHMTLLLQGAKVA
ncbi:MAG: hypothetical protein A3D31_08310 [Candidatus Fluviicola riflensis]|nr:MAG: hypothetical protein CHH17_06690 [Candidatus Fluviicola riflensis]OGS79942.1 MAG: hypothetical protein A3D31_08310 [Candidatus Fluviicola riflensis]OGS82457.1 MAG: hypothetical protein A2724_17255 [Fluviicola sp. RIFCSPHIGHO2_01_FULL_43_53]OGS88121.1 MAG: hypothetical protein A3E30_14690 [Fluviicola sp. RIFCSPHIGHO2_12_FULL_43_24]